MRFARCGIRSRRLVLLLVAATALANGGCLLVAAGVAGGAAVGYAYCKGKVCGLYNAGFADAWAATHTALGELGMPIEHEERTGDGALIVSRTADSVRLRIHLESESSRIQADGQMTRICVRVATFGDRGVSERVLDQIGLHLTPVPIAGAPPGAPGPPPAIQQTGAVAPAASSAPPPVAPATGAAPLGLPPAPTPVTGPKP